MEDAVADSVQRALTAPEAIRWLPLADLAGPEGLSCIDGRHHHCTVGAPGGNAGELVLALGVLEWFAGTAFDRAKVRWVLERVVAAQGRFYLHTDAGALGVLGRRLVADGVVTPEQVRSPEVTFDLIAAPPPELRSRLLPYLVDPRHVGCGHLRSLLTSPELYRVRKDLVESIVMAFFELHWARSHDTNFVALDGEHRELALLNVHTPSPLRDDTLVPSLCPANDGGAFFVNHVAALRYLRSKTVALLLRKELHARLERVAADDVLLELERLGERHLTTTLERLAPGLPRRRIDFDGESEQISFR